MNDVRIEIEWIYTPPGYFEEKIVWNLENYLVEIADGHITARMSADFFDSQPSLRDSLTQALNNYFRCALPIRLQAFEVLGGAINHIWPDGRRDTTLVVQPAEFVITGEAVDLVLRDAEGKIVGDSRRDRIEATRALAELGIRHITDPTARKILESFEGAVRDPENELVYLYEVWDALECAFPQGKAEPILNITRDRLQHLACDEPFNQGRHRGLFAGRLRDATAEELNEARAIARDMIVKYLNYLEKKAQVI